MRRITTALLVAAVGALTLTAAGSGSAGTTKPKLSISASKVTVASTYTAAKSAESGVAQSDPSLLNISSSTPLTIFIKYDLDSTASYAGGVGGLAATSPRITGKSWKDNQKAVSAYRAYATGQIQKITSSAISAVSGFQWKQSFADVYGGIVASVPGNQISKLLSVPGVVAVQKDALQQTQDFSDAEEQYIGATNAWNSLGGGPNAGHGVIVGVLDTGIWPEHPSFQNTNTTTTPTQAHACQFGDGSDLNLGPAATCNNKLIGAYSFMDNYMAVVGAGADQYCDPVTEQCSARDSDGHGTHTSSTAAGDQLQHANLFGIDRGPISGVAPGAQVIMYRVCGLLGCFDGDMVNAVEQAISDGVNVISYSIGGPGNTYTDPMAIAFLDAFNAGISVNAAAGNSGPTAGTTENNEPWVTTVGAITSNRQFSSTLTLSGTKSGGGTETLTKTGVTIMPGLSAKPVVLASAAPYSDAFCTTPAAAGTFTGDVVVCERGGTNPDGSATGRIQKGYDVLQGGAAGMILYNPVTEDTETDNHFLPAIHLDGPATDVINFITSHTSVTASWTTGQPASAQGDVMAAFSSRGPAPEFLKPDLVAPGVQVLAGDSPTPDEIAGGAPGQLFQAIAGTSMATPHSSGSSALVKAAHPTWDPAEIKSALMTSSVQDVVQADGTSAVTPFDDGAGSIRVDKALSPTLVFDENTSDYAASATDPQDRVNLNLPSIDATDMPGTLSTSRTAIDVAGHDVDMDVTTTAPSGAQIVVNYGQRTVHFSASRPTTFKVTITAPSLPVGQYFGRITLTPHGGGNPVTIPVAFNRTTGDVHLLSSCSPSTFKRITGHAHCTISAQNYNAAPAHATLTVDGFAKGQLPLIYSKINAPTGTIKTLLGFQWKGQLAPATPPQVTSVAPSASGDWQYGYFPLSSIGVPKDTTVDDETITNYDVPAFQYGAEEYDQIGVVSDGYVVIGGGDAGDVLYGDMNQFPDPTRPNNTLAPFWTDLDATAESANPATTDGVYVSPVGDGVHEWIVVDFENVPLYGSSVGQTFEIVIEDDNDGGSEGIQYEFGHVSDPGTTTGVLVGAENRDGTSGQNAYYDPDGGSATGGLPADGSNYVVSTTGPTAGGGVSIDYDATALTAGTYTSTANLTSDVEPGITQLIQTLTATK